MTNTGYRVWSKVKKEYVEFTLKSSIGFYIDMDGCIFEVTDDGFDNVEWHEMDNDVVIERYTGIDDIEGKPIHEGDIVVSVYVDPTGRVHEDIFDENKYAIKYMNGCYGIESKTQFIPLQNFLRQTEGEYISNAGNKILYGGCILKVVGNIHNKRENIDD